MLIVFSQSVFVNAQKGKKDEVQFPDSSSVISFIPEEEWDLFGKEGLVELSLKFDMRKYLKVHNEPEYQDAVLEIHASDTSIKKEVRIKSRGMFRRGYCAFPPLKLNIKKTNFDNEYLDDQKNFKIVTHCKHSYVFEDYLLKEFLVYKLYNQLTDLSFRVRLVKMQYMDTPPENKKPRKTVEKFGFIIEPVQSVANRNKMVAIKTETLGQKAMDKEYMALVAMFEYMIGNTDWSITGLHNLKIIKAMEFSKPYPYPVPYDFDYSGMVDAEYAIPIEELGIKSVTERLYRGICLPDEYVQRARNIFLKKKEALYKVIDDFQYLNKRSKENMKRYLNSFYTIIESDRSLKREIMNGCLGK